MWKNESEHLELPDGVVHVWRTDIDLQGLNASRHWEVLSPDERARAHRFRQTEQSTRYIVARGILRELIGRYLRRKPDSLQFVYGSHGKPALPRERKTEDLHFNVSHSENVVLYAFARGREVGVDVERVRPNVDAVSLANRWFTTREAETIRELPMSLQQFAFFKTWARKESYLKARGEGLVKSMRAFEVPAYAEEIGGTIELLEEPPEEATWRFEDLSVGPGWAAAIASEGEYWHPVLS